MLAFGLFVLLGFGVIGVPAERHPGHSKFCLSCHDVLDPTQCTNEESCGGPDDYCGTKVHNIGGVNHYQLGCFGGHDCHNEHDLIPIGKRQPHHEHGTETCKKCCSTNNCNKELCVVPTCRNHEEDGFTCNMLDSLNFCHDPNTVAHFIAHEKCPLHCGYCGDKTTTKVAPLVTSPLPTAATTVGNPDGTSPQVTICADDERNGFHCTDFDMFHFCNDTTSFAHPLAGEKCPKHCGFCS